MFINCGYQAVFFSGAGLVIVGIVYAALVMESNIIISENNNQEKKTSHHEGLMKLLLNTFTVIFQRREGRGRQLLILLVISFVLFEMTFPVDDNLLYLHFRVHKRIKSLSNVQMALTLFRTSSVGMKRTTPTTKPSGPCAWWLVSLPSHHSSRMLPS